MNRTKNDTNLDVLNPRGAEVTDANSADLESAAGGVMYPSCGTHTNPFNPFAPVISWVRRKLFS